MSYYVKLTVDHAPGIPDEVRRAIESLARKEWGDWGWNVVIDKEDTSALDSGRGK